RPATRSRPRARRSLATRSRGPLRRRPRRCRRRPARPRRRACGAARRRTTCASPEGRERPPACPSWPLREPLKLGPSLLEGCALALWRLSGQVEEQGRVAGELLDAGEAVVRSIARRLDHAQRHRAVLEHAPAPRHRLALELLERHDRVDQPHVERFLRVVLTAQEPDLPRLLLTHPPPTHP